MISTMSWDPTCLDFFLPETRPTCHVIGVRVRFDPHRSAKEISWRIQKMHYQLEEAINRWWAGVESSVMVCMQMRAGYWQRWWANVSYPLVNRLHLINFMTWYRYVPVALKLYAYYILSYYMVALNRFRISVFFPRYVQIQWGMGPSFGPGHLRMWWRCPGHHRGELCPLVT